MRTYDEASIVRRLSNLDRTRKAAFAAACAQRLLPLYLRYVEVLPGVDGTTIRSVIGSVWDVVRGAQTDLRPQQEMAEGQVPAEDDAWHHTTGYAQSAAACAAYAVRAWLTDDAQEAAWAARQVYEVSDYGAQQLLTDLDLSAPESEARLAGHTLVQGALEAIEQDLQLVESDDPDFNTLAARAVDSGVTWSREMP